MACYTSRTYEERKQIQGLWEAEVQAKEISDKLAAPLSSIYSKLRRGQDGTRLPNMRMRYDADLAQLRLQQSYERRGRKDRKLAFRSIRYAGPVIEKMRIPCTIEIRVAVQHWDKTGAWEIDGQSYILEATSKRIVQKPLTRGGGTGVEAWLTVDNFTANDEAGNPLWSFGKDEAGE